jgi:hypothetical protein
VARSPSAKQIMRQLTNELKSSLDVVIENRAEWRSQPARAFGEMLDLFQQWSDELTDRVSKMDNESWERIAKYEPSADSRSG